MSQEALKATAVRNCLDAAEARRPYKAIRTLIVATTPPGGSWIVEARKGAVTRSIIWNGQEVALVNPRGDLTDSVEGRIAMAMRALPVFDMAMRAIIVLAESEQNVELIRELATSVIAHVEEPAPRIPDPDGDDDDA